MEEGAYSSILQPSPKMSTLSFGGCSHLGVPCWGAFLGRVEQEGGKTSSDQYPHHVRININTLLSFAGCN